MLRRGAGRAGSYTDKMKTYREFRVYEVRCKPISIELKDQVKWKGNVVFQACIVSMSKRNREVAS